MSKHGTWTEAEALSAFLAGEPFIALSRRLRGSPNTIRRVLKAKLGEKEFEAIRDRNDPKKSTASEAEILAPFETGESLKAIATRLNLSPNTLRDKWVGAFGKEAVDARSKRLHSAAGSKAGSLWKGKKRVSAETIQAREIARGVDRRCPVCNIGCVGYQALTNHMVRAGDKEHTLALDVIYQKEKSKRWVGKVANQDYVVCAICSFVGESISNHIKLHGMTSREYYKKYKSPIRANALQQRRSEILSSALSQNLFTREDLLRYADNAGKIIVASVSAAYGHKEGTVLRYCRKYGLPTRNKLAWQKIVLDKAAAYLQSDYIWEWSDARIINPATGRKLVYDGFFPASNIILEAHGQQHFQYSELWHGTIAEFEKRREMDQYKEQKARELGFEYKIIRFTDPIESSAFWHNLFGDLSHTLWTNKTEIEKEQSIESVFTILRRHGWPEISPSPQIKAELTRLKNIEVYLNDTGNVCPYSTVGTYVVSTFFPNRYYAKRKNVLSAWAMWHDDMFLKKAIRLQLDSGHPTTPERVLKALVMFSRTPSIFRPVVAKYIYENYCPKGGRVWDPCAGYGGRLMAAVAAGVGLYLGTDIEPETVRGNQLLAISLEAQKFCQIEQANAVSFVPPNNLDLVFTSPPYFMLENYGPVFEASMNVFSDVMDWMEGFLKPVMMTAYNYLKSKGIIALNLPWKPLGGLRLDQVASYELKKIGFSEMPSIYMPLRNIGGGVRREPILIWQKS